MFEASGLSTSTASCTGDGCFNITGPASGNGLQGVMDLPSRNIVLASGLTSSGLALVNTLTLYNTMSWSISPDASTITNSGGPTVLLN